MTATVAALDPSTLLRTRKDTVDIVDVPEFGFAVVDGEGSPGGAVFAEALQALFAVSYGAHFRVKRGGAAATKVMPLEALWWVDDPATREVVFAATQGEASIGDTNHDKWRWRAMIMQPEAIDAATVEAVVDELQRTKALPGLARLRYERWEEGRCAQVLHVGPYADEGPSLVRLHDGIATAGYRPRGHHHEIYLGDPRRCAPEKLRTLLRHPVEPY